MKGLTPREIECLQWTGNGKSSRTIASILNISFHTVDFHRKQVLAKMDCSSVVTAVGWAAAADLLERLHRGEVLDERAILSWQASWWGIPYDFGE